MRLTSFGKTISAGLCGGIAEIVWVWAYSLYAGISGREVASQITATLIPGSEHLVLADAMGIGIHLLLSIAVAFAFANLPQSMVRAGSKTVIITMGVAVLALIWVVNFFVVLPALNPAFVSLMPYGVTLISKLLFGLSMTVILCVNRPSKTDRERAWLDATYRAEF